MKHNTLTKIITLALAVVLALSLAACGSKTDDNSGDATATTIKIGVPNDTTNEARALLLLQENGIIKLADEIVVIAGGQIAHRGTTEEIFPLILADTLGSCPVLERKEGAQ